MIPQTARALESLAHVTLATTLVAPTALPAGASSLHSTRSAGLSYTDLAAEALSGTRFEGASPATFEVEAFLTEEFIRADLGLFDLHVRATSLEDKDDAEDWLGVAGALLTTQQRFLEWIEARASSPDSYDDAFDDLQTLQKWSRKWKAKTLTRQATEGGIDLLDLFSAPEDVRAASERLATFMRTGGPLGLERSPRSEPIVLTPDRRDFVTMICWAGWMQPSLQSIFWQPAVSTWTHFYVNDIKVLAMEYAAPGTRAGELGGGLSMNDHTKDGLEQQIVQLSFGSLVDSYFGERIPPSIAGSIGVNMVIDLYGECDTRVDGDLRERRTEALEIFIPGGNPDGGGVGWDVPQHDAARADLGALADLDVAENLRPGGNQHAGPDLRVAVAALLPGSPERHLLEQGDFVFDHGGFSDDDAGSVVEEHALADARGRMDVDAQHLGAPVLEELGQPPPPRGPEHVGNAVGLEGMEPLEVEQRLRKPLAGRIPVAHRLEVGPHRCAERRVPRQHLFEDDAQGVRADADPGQPLGQVNGQGGLERAVVQDGCVQEAREHRLAFGLFPRLVADLPPDRVRLTHPSAPSRKHRRTAGAVQSPGCMALLGSGPA